MAPTYNALEMLQVYVGRPDGIGCGDMIQWASAIPEWQRQHPGQGVELAYLPIRNSDVLFNIPGVDYQKATRCPRGFVDLYNLHLVPGRVQRVFEALGLDWQRKRLWWFPTADELAYANHIWGSQRPRVAVPWHLYGGWRGRDTVNTPWLVEQLLANDCRVVVLDQDSVAPDLGTTTYRHEQYRSLRWLLAIAATADLFVGVSNLAFYAALGCNVPAVGVFTRTNPEHLFWPVTEPKCFVHWARDAPDKIPIDGVWESARHLLYNETMQRLS